MGGKRRVRFSGLRIKTKEYRASCVKAGVTNKKAIKQLTRSQYDLAVLYPNGLLEA